MSNRSNINLYGNSIIICNTGSGNGLFKTKCGDSTFYFKGISGGTGISIISANDVLTINSCGLTSLNDDVLKFCVNKYTLYSSKPAGLGWYSGNTNPDGVCRMNLNGILHTTRNCTTYLSSVNTNTYGVYAESQSGVPVFAYSSGSGPGMTVMQGGSVSNPANLLNLNRSITGTGNVSGNIISITDNPTTTGLKSGKVFTTIIGTTERIYMNPRVPDGSTAVAYMWGTDTLLNNASANHTVWKNQNTEIARLWKGGYFEASGFRSMDQTSAVILNTNQVRVNAGGYQLIEINATSSLLYKSNVSDGATAIAHVFDTYNALSTSGAKIFVLNNQCVEKVSVDRNGNINIPSGSNYMINNVPIGNVNANNGLTVTGSTVSLGGNLIKNTIIGGNFTLNVCCGAKLNTACGYQISGITMFRTSNQTIYSIYVGNDSGNNNIGCGNIGIGFRALKCTTVGTDNIGIGAFSLYRNNNGSSNISLGYSTLENNTSGSNNVAFGDYTMCSNINGNSNVAIGNSPLWSNTSGNFNIAFGSVALKSNTTGCMNVAVGTATLCSNVIGSCNVAIGEQSGFNSVGSRNVFIGACAGSSETGSDKLHIGNCNLCSLICGDFAGKTVKIDGGLCVTTLPAKTTETDVVYVDATGKLSKGSVSGGGGNSASVACATGGQCNIIAGCPTSGHIICYTIPSNGYYSLIASTYICAYNNFSMAGGSFEVRFCNITKNNFIPDTDVGRMEFPTLTNCMSYSFGSPKVLLHNGYFCANEVITYSYWLASAVPTSGCLTFSYPRLMVTKTG